MSRHPRYYPGPSDHALPDMILVFPFQSSVAPPYQESLCIHEDDSLSELPRSHFPIHGRDSHGNLRWANPTTKDSSQLRSKGIPMRDQAAFDPAETNRTSTTTYSSMTNQATSKMSTSSSYTRALSSASNPDILTLHHQDRAIHNRNKSSPVSSQHPSSSSNFYYVDAPLRTNTSTSDSPQSHHVYPFHLRPDLPMLQLQRWHTQPLCDEPWNDVVADVRVRIH